MALVFKGTRCSLCGSPIDTNKPYFATSGLFIHPEDPLWRFCDSAMHWDCYLKWPERRRFAKALVDWEVEDVKRSPYWSEVYHDEDAFVCVSLCLPERNEVAEVNVVLHETGSKITFSLNGWDQWDQWIKDAATIVNGSHLHPIEVEALLEALPLLREKYPTKDSLKDSVDWPLKLHLDETLEEERRKKEAQRVAALAEHNQLCAEWARKLKQEGLTCPHCRKHSKDIRFVDKTGQGKSYFICGLCGSSFGPEKDQAL